MTLQPDSLLHIYYLEGRVARGKKIANECYIGTWEEDGFSFLFFAQHAHETVAALVAAQSALKLLDTYQMTYEQWHGGKIEPHQIGGFLFTPPWFPPPEDDCTTVITLDPGVVFGNGLHPTTQDCLQALEIACSGQKIKTMLDLGTGTGILALAAIQHGCQQAFAVDSNLLAAQTAQRNVILNGLEGNVAIINGQAEEFSAIATDLLVANVHYAVMQKVIASAGFLKQKLFILSGVLTSEAERIEKCLDGLPVLILHKWSRGGIWHTFLGEVVKN